MMSTLGLSVHQFVCVMLPKRLGMYFFVPFKSSSNFIAFRGCNNISIMRKIEKHIKGKNCTNRSQRSWSFWRIIWKFATKIILFDVFGLDWCHFDITMIYKLQGNVAPYSEKDWIFPFGVLL